MAKQPTQQWILFLDRNQIQIYHPGLKQPFAVQIPETTIKDLEVIRPVELEKLLVQTLGQSKIPTQDPVFIILSDTVVLSETFPNATKESLKDKFELLVKRAPFNHVGWTTMQSGKNLVLVMANREVYEVLQEIMERLGFRVNGVTPISLLGLPVTSFSGQVGEEILKRWTVVKQHSLIYDPDEAIENENQLSSDPRRNKKLMMLLVALALLVVVLGGVIIKMYAFPDKPTTEEGVTPTPTETSASTPSEAAPTQEVEQNETQEASQAAVFSSVRIQVVNASGQTGLAESTKQTLGEAGFSQVETGNGDLINSERIQVVFNPSVPNPVREAILDALAPKFSNPSSREQAGLPFDAVVTLTNPS